MKLRTPKTITLEHRVTLPKHLAYLCDDDEAWIAANVRAGGHLNPAYLDAHERIDMKRRVSAQSLLGKDGEDYVKAKAEIDRAIGLEMVAALFDHLVDGWDTNIIDDETGKPLEGRDGFMSLANARIPEIADWVKGVGSVAGDIAKFIKKEDDDAVKN